MSFRYKTVRRPDGSTVKTPSIPIILNAKERLESFILLDSGADISLISKGVAEYLGIDLSGERMSSFGVGGEVQSVESKVTATIGKGHERYTFSMPVKVILDDYELPILAGREGFFDKFIITFRQSDEKVILKRSI